MTEHKLTIPGRLPGLNEYSNAERRNKYAGAKLKKQTEELIGWCILSQLNGLRIKSPVNISYLWVEPNKKRDPDNVSFGKKYINDALVSAGVLANDGWRQIKGLDDEFAIDKDNPRVEVMIREVKHGI